MTPALSVVISSHDYVRYLPAAIDSALALGEDVEVVVVDDGSTDGSPELIESYGSHVRAIFKDNGGQASALNAGFAVARGEAVVFLDADDVLLPGGAAKIVAALAPADVAKAHWPVPVIDAAGERTGEIQDEELPDGDLLAAVLVEGPLGETAMASPPMSGNAFARRFLERVMPVPEDHYRTGADEYLFGLAPAFGRVARLEPLSLYRVHGANDHLGRRFETNLDFQLRHAEIVCGLALAELRAAGHDPDERAWRRSTWWQRAAGAAEAIEAAVPAGATLALLDGDRLGAGSELRGRRVVAFPEHDGAFAGEPADDGELAAALAALESGPVRHIAVAWPAFWWLEEYPSLRTALETRWRRVHADADVLIHARAGS